MRFYIYHSSAGAEREHSREDDYKNIDVKGKIVFILTHEPRENDTTSVFDGDRLTDYGKIQTKVFNAVDHGAAGVIVVTDPTNHRFRRPPNVWPSLMRNAPEDAVPLVLDEKSENRIVAVRIGKDLARAFFEKRPERSILFCAWAGEENGLFGSRYYVNSEPLFPLEKTAANINLDMIGRNDSSRVNCAGLHTAEGFSRLVQDAAERHGMEVVERKGISGSDHVYFYQKKIPVLGFNTGLHEDYHQPGATVDKCDIGGMVQICGLVYDIVKEIAGMSERSRFTEPEAENQPHIHTQTADSK